MTKFFNTSLAACSLALAALSLAALPAVAATAKKPAKAAVKPTEEKPADKPTDEPEPDVAASTTTEFNCELGNKVTVYHNVDDHDHIALRWKKRLHRLTRVETTTGAQRFENKNYGLIWIGIPVKAMLLDSKQNRQLANECRNAEQDQAEKLKAGP